MDIMERNMMFIFNNYFFKLCESMNYHDNVFVIKKTRPKTWIVDGSCFPQHRYHDNKTDDFS